MERMVTEKRRDWVAIQDGKLLWGVYERIETNYGPGVEVRLIASVPHEEDARFIARLPELVEVCEAVLEEFEQRYDGAPDSRSQWMGNLYHRLESVIAYASPSKEARS